MLDGINSDAAAMARYPGAIELVGGYDDGRYAWSAADWALFPNSIHVHIAVFSTTNSGHILDVEPGNATPAQSVDWVLMRRKAGADPTVYMNTSTWPVVRAAFQARGVPQPHYWVAQYDGNPTIPTGAIGKQYADNIMLGKPWDISAVADYWPGIDPIQGADMTIDDNDLNNIAARVENRSIGAIASPASAPASTSAGVELASLPARFAAVNAKLDALSAKIGAPVPVNLDLVALEALIELHLAAGSVPGVIAAAVLQHLSADTARG
jgi:hypothetical protein